MVCKQKVIYSQKLNLDFIRSSVETKGEKKLNNNVNSLYGQSSRNNFLSKIKEQSQGFNTKFKKLTTCSLD